MTAARPRWAAVLGVMGELAITLGVLVGLFAVWQLWWTDVAATAAHAKIVSEFAEPLEVPAPRLAEERGEPPPVIEVPAEATTFALLRVPRWGADYVVPISEGVRRDTVLDVLGVGHYPGTAMPGQVGNFAVAGHRQTYGRPFFRVPELREGDALVVESDSAWYVYRVSETLIVDPRAVEVIAPVPGQPGAQATESVMTLTTCHPLYSTRQRFIVHGVLDAWVAKADGYPEALAQEATMSTESGE